MTTLAIQSDNTATRIRFLTLAFRWLILLTQVFLTVFLLRKAVADTSYDCSLIVIACAVLVLSIILMLIFSQTFRTTPRFWEGLDSFYAFNKSSHISTRRWVLLSFGIFGPTLLTSLFFASCMNMQALKSDKYEMTIDGFGVTGSEIHFIMPFAHTLRAIEKDQSTSESVPDGTYPSVSVSGITKDGAHIRARVSAQLRLTENPKYWIPKKETAHELKSVLNARFQASVSQFDSTDITPGNLAVAFRLGTANEFPLPPNAKWNGPVEISDLEVVFIDPK